MPWEGKYGFQTACKTPIKPIYRDEGMRKVRTKKTKEKAPAKVLPTGGQAVTATGARSFHRGGPKKLPKTKNAQPQKAARNFVQS